MSSMLEVNQYFKSTWLKFDNHCSNLCSITRNYFAKLSTKHLQMYLKMFSEFWPWFECRSFIFECSTKSWFPVKCVERFVEDVLLTWRTKKLFFPSSRRVEGRQMERYLNHPQTIKFLSNCDENEEEDSRI
jgi:hypothetical protein